MCDKKTCESCASYYVVRPTMGQGSCLLDELDKHGCAPVHDGCEEACMHWVPKPPTSEERCRQLEQLAGEAVDGYMEAAQFLVAIEQSGYGIGKWAMDYLEDAGRIADRLEDLGVSMDG